MHRGVPMQRGVPFAPMSAAVLTLLALSLLPAFAASDETHTVTQVPPNTLIVKGAWASSSDSSTPVPENGTATADTYTNAYFGLTFPLPADWAKTYDGPPPSDSGYYSLLQLTPSESAKGVTGNVLITAQDLFFTTTGARDSRQLIRFVRDHLSADYRIESEPRQIRLAGRRFVRLDYTAPAAGLHWRVLATQSRCHVLQFVFTSRDEKQIESLEQQMAQMKLQAEADPEGGTGGGNVPECMPDYARAENILERVDPVFNERRFNPIPVRIIIDREGRVKHVHLLSALPDQSRRIIDALQKWRFRPYLKDGTAVDVETWINFGPA